MEVMVGVVVLILIAMIAQMFIFEKTLLAWQERTYNDGLDVCNGVANALSIAGYSEGSSTQVSIPYDVGGSNYTLTVYDDIVTLDYSAHSCVRHFAVYYVIYNGSYPPFNLTGGVYQLNNTGGLVTIGKIA
jgi:hypothetical protein